MVGNARAWLALTLLLCTLGMPAGAQVRVTSNVDGNDYIDSDFAVELTVTGEFADGSGVGPAHHETDVWHLEQVTVEFSVSLIELSGSLGN